MTRTIALFAFCFGLGLIVAIGSLGATPLPGAAKGLAKDAATANAIQWVHGCHHFCARGPAGWHRHGPRCGRFRC